MCVCVCVCIGVCEYVCLLGFLSVCMCMLSRGPVSVTQQISWLKPITLSSSFILRAAISAGNHLTGNQSYWLLWWLRFWYTPIMCYFGSHQSSCQNYPSPPLIGWLRCLRSPLSTVVSRVNTLTARCLQVWAAAGSPPNLSALPNDPRDSAVVTSVVVFTRETAVHNLPYQLSCLLSVLQTNWYSPLTPDNHSPQLGKKTQKHGC